MPYGAIGPFTIGRRTFCNIRKGSACTRLRFSERAFGNVSGLKWHDANGDGKYTAGEEFLEGVNIGLDLDSDGSIDEVTRRIPRHYLFHYVRPRSSGR